MSTVRLPRPPSELQREPFLPPGPSRRTQISLWSARARLRPVPRSIAPLPRTVRYLLSVDAAHAEVFDFEEFLDAVFRAFAADGPAFLSCRRRGDLGRDDAFVDADDAVFEGPRRRAQMRPMSRAVE